MSSQVGALTLPVGADESFAFGDPALSILGEFFAAVLEFQAGEAFKFRTGFPVVRETKQHNPESNGGLYEADLPCLYLARQRDERPTQVADSFFEVASSIRIWWIRPPVCQSDHERIEPFGNAISKILGQAINAGRHPSYVMDGDTDAASQLFGTDIALACGFSLMRLGISETTEARVDGTHNAVVYPCVRAVLNVTELSDSGNPDEFGFSPFAIDVQINTGGLVPLDTPQHIRDPLDGAGSDTLVVDGTDNIVTDGDDFVIVN